MKTVKEWFELIKDDKIRKEALENMSPKMSGEKFKNVNEAIINGIPNWIATPQKDDYWNKIYESEIELLNEPKNDLLKRLEAIEERIDKMLENTIIEPREQQERKLIMSVDELKESDDFDDWRCVNGIITDTFKALKFIEHQWNKGKAFDWEDDELKYSLFLDTNEWFIVDYYTKPKIFNFHKKEHAELFLETFSKELEIIKPLFS